MGRALATFSLAAASHKCVLGQWPVRVPGAAAALGHCSQCREGFAGRGEGEQLSSPQH